MNDSGLDDFSHKRKDWNTYFCVAMASFWLWLFLFYFVSQRFSCMISSKYHQLSVAKRLNWDTRIGSNLHAVIVSAIALYCFFTLDTETRKKKCRIIKNWKFNNNGIYLSRPFDHSFIIQAHRRFIYRNTSSYGNMGILFRCGESFFYFFFQV
ncbi:PREDICTED: uncharacterized protein LOC107332464 isoform X2 [Acropora digitifera]|uniref:uncharacterized protein LOC107332464 isoform X2 n=1 Tax=Acropora digitifera TaxID=70779 RepID=UPI00077AC695|nr:PREDICTED: uncharacterized protein LOC107332464 isoform X2 [Acropora digitifera]